MQVRSLFLFLLWFSTTLLYAQNDSIWQQKPTLNLSGFLDVFYVYDFNQPQGTERQPFLFNHNRHNEFNLNLGFVKLGLEHSKYRANLALQTGTYSNDNYSAEPGLLKNIFEANVGLSLNKKNNLWIDAGVFASHIGFESAISSDNWTMTRSLLAENSPYFLSGAKLTYNPNDKLEIAGLIVNGWQRIQRLQGNSLPSFGTQINYSPTEKISFNWSTFIGTVDPDTTRRMRYFNNFYGQFQFTDKFGLIAGFDIGTQQRTKNSSVYDLWFSPVLIGQFSIKKNWKTAIRAEYYQDETGIIIPTSTPNGFKTAGLSLNFDYSPTENIICRLEGRWLNSRDQIFETKTALTDNNFIIATSIAIRFSETIKK
ncbi:porin [Bacteroidales bacterium OttesenSCG-928-K03]|nr:porin [Odoribacter sp. OttesenSCG-928-L07]MDL2239553.1 porin [Bacteroidales bacterium OttesenSCG-928-L14]MDL2241133.1 porin [Bacteroidales bacterium OttesenSCG-928-K22]MDL2242303.1 porin [Bacteroidales bacterium OttesenSCG-928-K03]